MDVAVVGAGKVGTALAVLWRRAGYEIVAVSGRTATQERAARYLPGVPVLPHAEAADLAELVLIAVPDDEVRDVCAEIATGLDARPGRLVAHTAGALALEVLDPVRITGAERLCLHPLQTFPDVDAAIAAMPGATIAVTADDEAAFETGESLVRDIGSNPVRLDEEHKALYHAAAVFASNYLVVMTALAEDLFARAGLDDGLERFLPLSRATLDNVAALGPQAALTGPVARGDAGTVARNLEALAIAAPDAIPAYVVLARVALDLAERGKRLGPQERGRVDEVLARWT
ncbi:MAG: DUF2520 domain-containing protein [Actinomycetota bacterium]